MTDSFFRQQFNPATFPPVIRAKWSDEVLKEGFVPLPKKVMRCMHLVLKGENALAEMAVLLAIADHKRVNVPRNPSREFLAFVAGMQKERFSEILDDLEKRKLITVEQQEDRIKINMDGFLKEINKQGEGGDERIFEKAE